MDKIKTKVDELRESLGRRKVVAAEAMDVDPDATVPESSAEADGMPTAEQLPTGEDLEGLRVQLAEAEQKMHGLYEQQLRSLAEFDNFRKRTEREKGEAIAFANEKLLKEMIPVLDHLDVALTNIQPEPARRALADGVDLTLRQFLAVLGRFGLTEVPADAGSAFDPSIHEAIAQVKGAEDTAAGSIVSRERRGYALHGRLLRAALVTVAK